MNINSTEREFLERVSQNNEMISIFIRNGFQEKGKILKYDNVSLLFVDEKGVEKLIYIDAISTISRIGKPTGIPSKLR